MIKTFPSELIYLNQFPMKRDLPENSVIIIDQHLLKFSKIKTWLKQFPFVYPLEAGEKLKQLSSFEKHLSFILNKSISLSMKNICFVAVGGGSVGDFVGFMASVYKRGSSLIQIPSTWLAAIDSAHGGKTALNIKNFKNQIGTFYPAQKVILCKSLLLTQPDRRTHEAIGEILKTALLSGGKLWKALSQESNLNKTKLWSYLPQLINYKYKIVEKDPFEKIGIRYVLNLGHTFGHAFELYFKIPHGEAVNLGLVLSLAFSKSKGIMNQTTYNRMIQTPLLHNYLASRNNVSILLRKHKSILQFLSQDKKLSSDGKINFVFLSSPGKPIVLKVEIEELSRFIQKVQLIT